MAIGMLNLFAGWTILIGSLRWFGLALQMSKDPSRVCPSAYLADWLNKGTQDPDGMNKGAQFDPDWVKHMSDRTTPAPALSESTPGSSTTRRETRWLGIL
jgi:hypothetical protein